jgi:c-di-GMP-binding flagellar brake protein YcgR
MNDADKDFTDDLKAFLAINELVQVQIPEDPNPATYYSRINDISEGKFLIAWPTNAGIRLAVRRDQMLNFFLVRDETPYSFTGLVDETYLEPLPQITIIVSGAIMRVQRRQNFRIKCLIPIEIVGAIQESSREESTSVQVIRTTTFNLSASGLAILHPKRIPEGTLLEVRLELPDMGPAIKIPGRVIYSENNTANQMLYRTGIRYLVISEKERARIVRYVYRTQLKGLRMQTDNGGDSQT